jgi:hypothetical protein
VAEARGRVQEGVFGGSSHSDRSVYVDRGNNSISIVLISSPPQAVPVLAAPFEVR